MTQKEKLIELLKSPHKAEQLRKIGANIGKYEDDCVESMVADFLLANGVIVLPCKVGDTVYIISDYTNEILDRLIIGIIIKTIFDTQSSWSDTDIGKTVFLSHEEAEKALAERIGE